MTTGKKAPPELVESFHDALPDDPRSSAARHGAATQPLTSALVTTG